MIDSNLSLVLGGVRSGKSEFAESLARDLTRPTLYVATARPSDTEMEERIRRHRERRPAHWSTLEEPLDLAGALKTVLLELSASDPPPAVLVDSLDTWVSNMLLDHQEEGSQAETLTLAALDRMLKAQRQWPESWFLVSSEVGLSPVPPNPLGRRFQDLLGLVNQRVAAAAGRVCLVVAGIPVEVKGGGHTIKGQSP